MPSGPGWFVARVRTMKRRLRRHVVAVAGDAVGAAGDQRVVGLQRHEHRAAAPLTVWSTPWSKNWPKNVNSELYGGDRPTSVVTFGMNSVSLRRHAAVGRAVADPRLSRIVVHGDDARVALRADRERRPRRRPPGWSTVWSTIRLLMTGAASR